MAPNIEDVDIANAERDASPGAFHDYDPTDNFDRVYSRVHEQQSRDQPFEETEGRPLEAVETQISSSRSLSTTGSSHAFESIRGATSSRPSAMHRESTVIQPTDTQIGRYLERHPTAVERIETHRLQHQITVGSSGLRSRKSKTLPAFGGQKPYPPMLPEKEEYVVEFDGFDDPLHAQNWPVKTKTIIAAILIFDSVTASLSSSIFSNAATAVGKEFHKGREVTTLATSLYVLGYAFGPIIWAPISELYGRRLPIIFSALAFGVFNITVAIAKDYQTIMLGRFFSGLCGSCPLAVVAAVFADMYNNKVRGLAIAAFSATVFMGPLIGPFLGGFITTSYLGWRWTQYITAFMGFFACILALFFQKESYAPVILVGKASELRRVTRNWGIHAKQEEVEVDLMELVTKNVSRPLRILFTEPIVLLITIYMSFLYGLLYLFLTAYAIVFQEIHGFSPGVAGLPYFGFIIGELIGFAAVVVMNPSYVRKLGANHNVPVPEWRLPLVMAGGISFAIGLFWFGWTGYTKSIPWIVPTLSGLASGFGIFTVFLQLLNYIVDAYLMFAASAIAGNTFMRSLFACIFPLFATYMFDGIGINWGMTLIGCVAVLLIPLPFIFHFKGKSIRARSKFAPAPDIEMDRKRDEEESMAVESDGTADGNVNGEKRDEEKQLNAVTSQDVAREAPR
ncbi:MAG: hypothetical protein M1821_005024 [Bathelium mastoideum]|nr:MAG: hypothetical protein M1821_005024 [Bathelium mastoideum]